MRADTRGGEVSSGGFDFSTNIDAILQHRFHRTSAARWATNLRFLTFAGDEICTDTKVSEESDSTKKLHRGQCARCELRVPPAAGHVCVAHARGFRKPDIKSYEKRAKEYTDPCIHVEDASCEECLQIPLFPNRGKVTKFRIRRLKPKGTKASDLGICTHFVAVSYCWSNSSAQKSNEPGTNSEQYQVLEEDMKTVRPIRAPKDTIDRAVSFAAQNGFRMIWIDQECIEQDIENEKELGIQAMDIVYVNAHISIGMFQVTLDQRHLDALLLFFEWTFRGLGMRRRGPRPLKQSRTSFRSRPLAEALSMIAMDRWNTRAWILQEAFASAGNMILLFPRAKEISVRGWSMICHDLSFTEIGIRLETLQMCVEHFVRLFAPKPDSSTLIELPQWAETLKRLTWFLPERATSHMFNFWLGSAKPRRTCNAAVALSFLKHRDNGRVADRLAILANLCDYSLRLNTAELERSQSRLSVCIFALTIANGDFSLLSPESYQIPRGLNITQNRGNSDFTWVPPNVTQLQYIRSSTADPGGATPGRASPFSIRVTKDGLSTRGFLWRIDHFVELASIKHKYKESWARLWRRSKGLEERSLKASEEPHLLRKWSRVHWLAATQIVFEVIDLLRAKNEKSVADAIWHSVMDADWASDWRKGKFLETVDKFPEQLTVEKRRDDEYIDRILDRDCESNAVSGEDQIGCDRQNQRLEDKLPSPAQEHAAPKLEQPGAASCFQAADDVTRDSGQLLSPAATPHPHNKRIDSSDFLHKSIEAAKVKTISEYQCVISMLRKKIDHASMLMSDYWEGEFDGPDNPDGALWWSPENITDYLALKYDIDGRNSQASLRQQRAIFDIAGDNSGQVLVLTPFQKRLETLPRPEARSMSASWVVHSVPDVARSEDSGGLSLFETILGTLKTSGMVRGMWKNMVAPEAVYKVV